MTARKKPAPKRAAMSKRVRFEVFKRDAFACQYCGQKAPDVILEIDHISPVSKGGKNDILNLVTACQACNSGKSDRELTDNSAIERQRAQLEELNERRDQLAMMLKWREGLKGIEEETAASVMGEIHAHMPGLELNESGKAEVRKWLRKYTFAEILAAVQISADRYLKFDDDGKIDKNSAAAFIDKIPGIAWSKRQPDDVQALRYIRGIARNRFNYINERQALEYLEAAYDAGVSVDELKAMTLAHSAYSAWRDQLIEMGDR